MLHVQHTVVTAALALVVTILFFFHRRLSTFFHRGQIPQSSHSSKADRSTTRHSTRRELGLVQIYPKQGEETETDVDIIAIHGLDTRSPDTWTWKSRHGDSGVNWLSDNGMLPSKVGPARIFTCDWPSDLFEDSKFVQKTFDEFARLLRARIEALPLAPNQSKHHQRPILFVASCLGGIILMKALVLASPEYVKKAVYGIVFLATPFNGTSFRDVAEWAEPGLRMWALIQDRKVSNLLQKTISDPEIENLRRDFTALCQKCIQPDYMTAFYELGKSSLPRKIIPCLPTFLAKEKQLVDKESASLDVIADRLSLKRKHVEMNKFSDPFDQDYLLVVGRIQNILQKIREGRTLYMADKWITNHCYTTEKLAIQRITHTDEPLAMEKCFINLLIVETAGEARKAEEYSKSSAQFSIHNRLKIQEPDEEMQVDIQQLFDPRKGKHSKTIQPRRILIRGHAGVGKSTLCKKLIHNFKEIGIWRNMFARVLWVPLRNLKRQDNEKKSLQGVLRQEFFLDSPKPEGFSRELEMELKADGGEKTLFILDGLDEVYEGLETNNYMYELLHYFLRRPAVIVTCRPNVSLAFQRDLNFDLELETIGFSPEQVNSYMQNVLTIPGEAHRQRVPDVQKIDTLQSLLQRHQLLQDLVRIPIQLDALCYIWADDDNSLREGATLETMTNIYQAIVERLWKKDIPKLHFEDGKRSIPKADMEKASLRMIEHDASRKQYLLERFAFSGLVDNVINFERKYQQAILEEDLEKSQSLTPSEEPLLSAGQTLPRLSFWRASNPSARHPTYHFLHLTFQEYFAARYFVRQWKVKEPLRLGKNSGTRLMGALGTLLMDHRYDPRYDIFWRFVTGLLSLEGKEICKFFSLLENSPRDLLGPVHERLIIHCLSEVTPDQLFFSEKRKELESRVADWLKFECDFAVVPRLASEVEVSTASLKAALESGDTQKRIAIVEALTHRPAIPIEVIHLSCSWLNADIDERFKISILSLIARQQSPPDGLVYEAVVARFRDKDSNVQHEAISTFESWSLPRNQVLDLLMPLAKDKESPIQWRAIGILGKFTRLDDEIIDDLEMYLNSDDRKSVKPKQIMKILASQIQYRGDILGFITAQLEKHDICYDATKILLNHPDLDEDAFENVFKVLGSGNEFYGRAAVRVLGSLNRLEEAEDLFRVQLLNQDSNTQIRVIKALKKWPELGARVVRLVAEALEDTNKDMRSAAIEALEQQPHLSRDIVDIVKARAQDETEDVQVRRHAIRTLMKRKLLDDSIDDMVRTWLRKENVPIRAAVLEALGTWPQPSNEILDTVLERLEAGGHYTQEKALNALRNWSQLNDTMLHTIAQQLNSEELIVRVAAAKALQNRPRPKDHTIQIIVSRLKLSDFREEGSYTGATLLKALGKWDGLDDDILLVVAEQLDASRDKYKGRSFRASKVSYAAAEFFLTRPQPNNEILGAINDHLKNTDFVTRKGALRALGNWSQLSDEILTNIAAHLGDGALSDTAFVAIMKQSALPFTMLKPYMQRMYEASLQIGFREHIYWLANEKPCIVNGERRVYWVKTGSDGADLDSDDIQWLQESVLKWRQDLKPARSSRTIKHPWARNDNVQCRI